MAQDRQPSLLTRPLVLKAVVMLALLVNGLFWAVRFPAWHPNDEPQHYLYASQFDGVQPAHGDPEAGMVPRDLQAYTQLVEFGPHRTVKQIIDLSDARAQEMAGLRAEADDPALAAVLVSDSPVDDMKIIGHADFENYHPPLYYLTLGQVLRVGNAAGLGLRCRLLMGRTFSVLLGLLAAWLAMMLGRVFWPEQWALPALVGFMTGMQILVAFYTSVLNNEVMAYVLFTAFLVLGAKAIVDRPRGMVIAAMVGVGILAGATKITMVVLLPMGLIALMLCAVPKWVRLASGGILGVFVGVALLWLLIPIGGGESLQDQYAVIGAEVRSLPPEMFTPGRLWEHAQMLRWYWGIRLGAAGWTDAWMPYKLHYAWSALTIASLLAAVVLFRGLDGPRRRLMLWLLTAPLGLGTLLYAIDYRFASMIGGSFTVRPQYYMPAAAAQMMWMVWGLAGGFKGRTRTVVAGGLAVLLVAFNLWAVHRVYSPRYYGDAGWWAQCGQIAELWPVAAWAVALLDGAAVGTAALAAVALIQALKATEADARG